jgi:hypothetical protein
MMLLSTFANVAPIAGVTEMISHKLASKAFARFVIFIHPSVNYSAALLSLLSSDDLKRDFIPEKFTPHLTIGNNQSGL